MGIKAKLILASLDFLILLAYGLTTFTVVLIISVLIFLVYKIESERSKKRMKA